MTEGKVLLIEDNPLNMELAVDLLELGGYEVLTATTAEEGIELAQKEIPSLILMDISLPGIDGLEATRILKKDKKIKDVPIVAMSAHAMTGDKEKAMEAGCVGYITKPIDTKSLVEKVKEFMG